MSSSSRRNTLRSYPTYGGPESLGKCRPQSLGETSVKVGSMVVQSLGEPGLERIRIILLINQHYHTAT